MHAEIIMSWASCGIESSDIKAHTHLYIGHRLVYHCKLFFRLYVESIIKKYRTRKPNSLACMWELQEHLSSNYQPTQWDQSTFFQLRTPNLVDHILIPAALSCSSAHSGLLLKGTTYSNCRTCVFWDSKMRHAPFECESHDYDFRCNSLQNWWKGVALSQSNPHF